MVYVPTADIRPGIGRADLIRRDTRLPAGLAALESLLRHLRANRERMNDPDRLRRGMSIGSGVAMKINCIRQTWKHT